MYGGHFSGYGRDVHGNSFHQYLENLEKICIETKLMLNWEKYHFMVTEGIVLGHKISRDALRFLFQRKDAKPHLIRWIVLLFKFDIEIKDKKGAENVAADHLSRLEDPKREKICEEEIRDIFPYESIDFIAVEKQVWDDPFLFKIDGDWILRRCVTKEEGLDILKNVHEVIMVGMPQLKSWVESQPFADNDARVVMKFLKKLFTGFENTRAIISARGTHFCNTVIEKALAHYRVTQRKLISKWMGPYLVKEVFSYGVVELANPDNGTS
ncbi:uncharacterized protein LOC143633783 [Bidens hawaiensis]|uniref:uncharacterized protein LOC143633783 n=1 Tax=Bidens hawaiensis TaxID=980011 RepID=UPI00404A39DA